MASISVSSTVGREIMEVRLERNSGHRSDFSEEELRPNEVKGVDQNQLVCSRAEAKSKV